MTAKNKARFIGAGILGVVTFFTPDFTAAGLIAAAFLGTFD